MYKQIIGEIGINFKEGAHGVGSLDKKLTGNFTYTLWRQVGLSPILNVKQHMILCPCLAMNLCLSAQYYIVSRKCRNKIVSISANVVNILPAWNQRNTNPNKCLLAQLKFNLRLIHGGYESNQSPKLKTMAQKLSKPMSPWT